jgi:aspartyl-tRNA(Asn)/glutamyl-tRNA(Gln) amidotransferase subunit B
MFCECPVTTGGENKFWHTCPICLGLPGALPVMNHEALRMTVLTGSCWDAISRPSPNSIAKLFLSGHAEEYQISQYDMPLCTNGSVPLHDLAYPKDAQKNIATPDKEIASGADPSRGGRSEEFPFRKQHGHRFQSRRHTADGNRDATGNQFA